MGKAFLAFFFFLKMPQPETDSVLNNQGAKVVPLTLVIVLCPSPHFLSDLRAALPLSLFHFLIIISVLHTAHSRFRLFTTSVSMFPYDLGFIIMRLVLDVSVFLEKTDI